LVDFVHITRILSDIVAFHLFKYNSNTQESYLLDKTMSRLEPHVLQKKLPKLN